jgi:hypothetical protein
MQTCSRISLCILLAAASTCLADTSQLESVGLSPDGKGFVLMSSGRAFVPWGNNYGSVDILDRLDKDPARVERDFGDMKAAGATMARVHPEMPMLMLGPDRMDPHGLQLLGDLLKIAEKTGVYLDVTGLACYKINHRMAWYDALDAPARWKTQAFFWEHIAEACAKSPAVFCYCLINEPVSTGKKSDGWYFGKMGDVEFCQRLWLDPDPPLAGDGIFRKWTAQMTAAIRKHDPHRLITLGMFPFPGIYKTAADNLDFVSPHLYPRAKEVNEEIKLLKQFDYGKPMVIEETFVLSCGVDDEREFLLKSKGIASGWVGHWPDDSPAKLDELKKSGKLTIGGAIWLAWVNLFKELTPQMTRSSKSK